VDKNSGANTTQGAAGRAADFEIHPVGTAERLRQLGIIGVRAAELLEEEAKLLFESHKICGIETWIEDDPTKEVYDEFLATAGYLRALCAPGAVPVKDAEKRHFIEMKSACAPAVRTGRIAGLGGKEVVSVVLKDVVRGGPGSKVKFDAEGMVLKIITEDVTRGIPPILRRGDTPMNEKISSWDQFCSGLKKGDIAASCAMLTESHNREMSARVRAWLSGGYPIPDDLKSWLMYKFDATEGTAELVQIIPGEKWVVKFEIENQVWLRPVVCFGLMEYRGDRFILPFVVLDDGNIEMCESSDEGFKEIFRIDD
jgi:hypothetical protein